MNNIDDYIKGAMIFYNANGMEVPHIASSEIGKCNNLDERKGFATEEDDRIVDIFIEEVGGESKVAFCRKSYLSYKLIDFDFEVFVELIGCKIESRDYGWLIDDIQYYSNEDFMDSDFSHDKQDLIKYLLIELTAIPCH